MLPLIILTVIPVVFFSVKNRMYLSGEDEQHIAYLRQNMEVLQKDGSQFKCFDSSFYESNIFLLAENHGYADVQDIDFQIFQHLNKKVGVRFYIAEMDSIRANMLNEFLRNNKPDVSLLQSIVKDIAIRIPQQSSKQLYDKWMKLYDYNKTLNDSLKIEVLGIDKNFNDTQSKIGRDSSMLLNFEAIVEKRALQKEKFYGLFGFYHGMQSGISESNIYPFAGKLKRQNMYPQFQNVQTIACLTLESEMYLPPTEEMITPPNKKMSQFNVDGPILLTKGINDMKGITTENSITLFHLNKPNSPYGKSQRLAGIKVNVVGEDVLPNNLQQATTDFYQYVMLIRGSKSLSPIE